MKVIESSNSELPLVKVTDAAMRAVYSDISVDLDGLNQLLRNDLGLVSEERPEFVLYGRSRKAYLQGFHLPFSHTAHIQIPTAARIKEANDYSIRHGVSRVLVHESSHLVDSMDYRRRTLGETAMRLTWNGGMALSGGEVANTISGPQGVALGVGAAIFGQRMFYDYLDRGEIRAREVHHDQELINRYQNVIQLVDCPFA